jgi:hypothetical protein
MLQNRDRKRVNKKRLFIIIMSCLFLWFFGKIIGGAVLLIPHPWTTKISGNIHKGEVVVFQSRVVGREAENILLWKQKDHKEKKYNLSSYHAGYDFIKLKMSENFDGIWIEADNSIIASLDLSNGNLRGEGESMFNWAVLNGGILIAEGKTGSWIDYIIPW